MLIYTSLSKHLSGTCHMCSSSFYLLEHFRLSETGRDFSLSIFEFCNFNFVRPLGISGLTWSRTLVEQQILR